LRSSTHIYRGGRLWRLLCSTRTPCLALRAWMVLVEQCVLNSGAKAAAALLRRCRPPPPPLSPTALQSERVLPVAGLLLQHRAAARRLLASLDAHAHTLPAVRSHPSHPRRTIHQ
jgi:hypothetical protein